MGYKMSKQEITEAMAEIDRLKLLCPDHEVVDENEALMSIDAADVENLRDRFLVKAYQWHCDEYQGSVQTMNYALRFYAEMRELELLAKGA